MQSIPGPIQLRVADPADTMESGLAIRDEMERRRTEKALQSALAQYPDDPDQAVRWLTERGYGDLGMQLAAALDAQRAKRADTDAKELETHAKEVERFIQGVGLVTPETYGAWAEQLAAMDPNVRGRLPASVDAASLPALKQSLLAAAVPAKDQFTQHAQTLRVFLEGKADDAIAADLGTVTSREHYEALRQKWRYYGANAQVDAYGDDWQAARQAALERGYDANERADDARANLTLEEQMRANRANEATARGQLGVAQGNLAERRRENAPGAGGVASKPEWVTRQDAKGNWVKVYERPTEGQTVPLAPTADMRNRSDAIRGVVPTIMSMRDLSTSIISRIGPAQRADAAVRGVQAVFGHDPDFRVYQDFRAALAATIAVAIQGSRPSDADVFRSAMPMIPDPYSDTAESAKRKWELIIGMFETRLSPEAKAELGLTGGSARTTGAAATPKQPTHRFNPKTGKFEKL